MSAMTPDGVLVIGDVPNLVDLVLGLLIGLTAGIAIRMNKKD